MQTAFRRFRQGTKVAVQVVMCAVQAGLVDEGERVVGVGGSSQGADTALVIRASWGFPNITISEVICYSWGDRLPGHSFDEWPIFAGWPNVCIENRSDIAVYNVCARVTGWPANTTVADRDVTVGSIPAESSAWSEDTFTTRVDMTIPGVDPCEGLVWRIEYDDAVGAHHVVEHEPRFRQQRAPATSD